MASEEMVVMPDQAGADESGNDLDLDLDNSIQISINSDYDEEISDSNEFETENPTSAENENGFFEMAEEDLLSCTECDRKFACKEFLKKHQITHKFKRSFVCRHCQMSCSSEKDLHVHLKTHLGEMPHMCDICGKGFANVYHYRSHYRTHTGEKPYKCGICGKRFTTSTGLRYHEKTRRGTGCSVRVSGKTRTEDLNKKIINNLPSIVNSATLIYVAPPPGLVVNGPVQPPVKTEPVKIAPKIDPNSNPEDCSVGRLTAEQKKKIVLSYNNGIECMICGKKFPYPAVLKSHMRIHTDQEIDNTLKRFQQTPDSDYVSKVSSWKPYACKNCSEEFSTSEDLKHHMLSHSIEKPHVCNYCGKCFGKSHNLNAHVRTHTGEKPFKCKDCGKRFTTSTGFRYHNKVAHGGTATHISVEDAQFEEADDGFLKIVSVTSLAEGHSSDIDPAIFEDHIKKETDAEVGQFSAQSSMVLSAEDINEMDKPSTSLECEVCGTVFEEKDVLARHMKKHRAILKKKMRSQGNSSIAEQSSPQAVLEASEGQMLFKQNVEGSSSERPRLACGICYKVFKRPYHLTIHMKKHTGQRDFPCLYCQKKFITNCRLRLHMQKKHPGVKLEPRIRPISNRQRLKLTTENETTEAQTTTSSQFTYLYEGVVNKQLTKGKLSKKSLTCVLCGRVCRTEKHLKLHSYLHTGEKRFKCSACGKTWDSYHQLADHKRLHTGLKPFKCQICYRRFRKSSHLNCHQKIHPSDNPNKCKECEKWFTTAKELNFHLKIVHNYIKTKTNLKKHRKTRLRKKVKVQTPKKVEAQVPQNVRLVKMNTTLTDPDDIKVMQEAVATETSSADRCAEIANEIKNAGRRKAFILPTSPSLQSLQVEKEVKKATDEGTAEKQMKNATTETTPEKTGVRKSKRKSTTPTYYGIKDATEEIKEEKEERSKRKSITPTFYGIDDKEKKEERSKRKSTTPMYYGIKRKDETIEFGASDLTDPTDGPSDSQTRSQAGTAVHETNTVMPPSMRVFPEIIASETLSSGSEILSGGPGALDGVPDDVRVMAASAEEYGQTDDADVLGNILQQKLDYVGDDESVQDINLMLQDELNMFSYCQYCSDPIRNSEFQSHMEGHEANMFECSVCRMKFIDFDAKRRHEILHPREIPFECTECGLGFSHGADLQAHRRVHKSKKKHECLYCGKFFGKSDNLKSHVRTHTGEKPYQCKICSKTFTTSTGLRYHETHRTPANCYKGMKVAYRKDHYQQAYDIIKSAEKKGVSKEELAMLSAKPKGGTNTLQLDSQQVLVFPKTPVIKVDQKIAMKETLKKLDCKLPKEAQHVLNAPDVAISKTSKHGARGNKDQGGLYQHSIMGRKNKAQCPICLKILADQSGLRKHLRIHSGEKPFRCDVCRMSFARSDYLNKHKLSHVDENPYRCEVCDQSFKLSVSLNKHRLKEHLIHPQEHAHVTDKPFKCLLCSKSFAFAMSLSKHKLLDHMIPLSEDLPDPVLRYPCTICSLEFETEHILEQHMTVHELQCPKCSHAFKTDRLYEIHCGICTGDKEDLGEEPDVSVKFEGFEITCSPPGSDVDEEDDEEDDDDVDDVEDDDNEEEQEGDDSFDISKRTCTLCGRVYECYEQMMKHLKTHKGVKVYPCPNCDQSYTLLHDLEDHIANHDRSKPDLALILVYEKDPRACNLCGKTFNSQGKLKSHYPEHLGGATYKCSRCRQPFYTFREAKRHSLDCKVRNRNCSKPVCCSFCGKQFIKQDHIKCHIRIHTDEKPYECKSCGKCFAVSTGLRLHERRGPPNPCAPEGYQFEDKSQKKKNFRKRKYFC